MVLLFFGISPGTANEALLKSYLKLFYDNGSTKLELEAARALVLQLESARRPNRGSNKHLLVICVNPEDTDTLEKYNLNFKEQHIKLERVITPKPYLNNDEYPYRVIVASKLFISNFVCQNSYTKELYYIKHTFKLKIDPIDFRLNFENQDLFKTHLSWDKSGCSIKERVPVDQLLAFGFSPQTVIEAPPPVPKMETVKAEDVLQSVKQLAESLKNNSNTFTNTSNIKLGNIWCPDRVGNGTSEDMVAVLRQCKLNKSFSSDSNLVFSYLNDNNMLNRLSDLTTNQKTDLEEFIKWLTSYVRQDDLHFRNLFKQRHQKEGECFKTFFLSLSKLYRKAYNKKEDLSESDKKAIKRQYLKHLSDKVVRDKLIGLPEDSLTVGGDGDIVKQSEYFQSVLRDLGSVTNDQVNVMTAVTTALNEMNLFTQQARAKLTEEKSDKPKHSGKLRCFNCNGLGHFANECRSSDKFRRKNTRGMRHNGKPSNNNYNNDQRCHYNNNHGSYRPLREFPDRNAFVRHHQPPSRGQWTHRGNNRNGYHPQNYRQSNQTQHNRYHKYQQNGDRRPAERNFACVDNNEPNWRDQDRPEFNNNVYPSFNQSGN